MALVPSGGGLLQLHLISFFCSRGVQRKKEHPFSNIKFLSFFAFVAFFFGNCWVNQHVQPIRRLKCARPSCQFLVHQIWNLSLFFGFEASARALERSWNQYQIWNLSLFLALRPQLEHWNTMLMESIMIHSQNLIKCMLALLPLLILNFVPFVLHAF